MGRPGPPATFEAMSRRARVLTRGTAARHRRCRAMQHAADLPFLKRVLAGLVLATCLAGATAVTGLAWHLAIPEPLAIAALGDGQ